MDDEQKYRLISLKFIETNRIDLIRIYSQHYATDGEGILAINFTVCFTNFSAEVSLIFIFIYLFFTLF